MNVVLDSKVERLLSYRDTDGRYLGEQKSGAPESNAAETAFAECAYAGSRGHHIKPLNLSALNQLRRHWTPLIELLKALGSLHCQATTPSRMTVLDAWRVCRLAQLIPPYLAHRAVNPQSPLEIPAVAAVAFKTTLGLEAALRVYLLDRILAGHETAYSDPFDAAFLYDFVESRGLLIGATQVCAAPETMIRTVLRIVGGEGISPAAKLPPMINDSKAFYRYANQLSQFQFARILYDALALARVAEFYAIARELLARAPRGTGQVVSATSVLERLLGEWQRSLLLRAGPYLADGIPTLSAVVSRLAIDAESLDVTESCKQMLARPSPPEHEAQPFVELVKTATGMRNITEKLFTSFCAAAYDMISIEHHWLAIGSTVQRALLDSLGHNRGPDWRPDSGCLSKTSVARALAESLGLELAYTGQDATVTCRDNRARLSFSNGKPPQ